MTTRDHVFRGAAALTALVGALMFALVAGPRTAGATTVTVQPGQNLTQIAAANGTTISALAAANGITDPNHILAGTTLVIPGSEAAEAPATPTPTAVRTVTVMLGNTLSAIAAQYGVTVAQLAAANSIANPNVIVVGTTLTVPGATAPGAPAAAPAAASPTVIVMIGDTLSAIGARYGVSVAQLAAANGITDPNLVTVGRRLVIPTSTAASSTSLLPPQLLAEPSILALRPLFVQWANHFGISPALLEAMCWWESGWQSQIVSSTGAIGIGQLEPGTVAAMQAQLQQSGLNPYAASDNIEMAAAFLADLLRQTGSAPSALAGYYQGLTSVALFGELPGTMQYVSGITAYVPHFS
ncbi:MAG TPA: LysM peptidoglycan-binding domain-containing protein [Acidimicrobiales bacterium]|nr:LysM peptidoglycan-binding domain-containing protein [Acidimicrobiales bacterium]